MLAAALGCAFVMGGFSLISNSSLLTTSQHGAPRGQGATDLRALVDVLSEKVATLEGKAVADRAFISAEMQRLKEVSLVHGDSGARVAPLAASPALTSTVPVAPAFPAEFSPPHVLQQLDQNRAAFITAAPPAAPPPLDRSDLERGHDRWTAVPTPQALAPIATTGGGAVGGPEVAGTDAEGNVWVEAQSPLKPLWGFKHKASGDALFGLMFGYSTIDYQRFVGSLRKVPCVGWMRGARVR